MNLRDLPSDLSSSAQCDARRAMIEKELELDLAALQVDPSRLGAANEKNCEQMFGHLAVPMGLAGPLSIHFSSDEKKSVYLPLATTEGALVASMNRGCKAASVSGVRTTSKLCGITRSIALKPVKGSSAKKLCDAIMQEREQWRGVGEATSKHLQIIGYDMDIDHSDDQEYVFLTVYGDTGLAMGMNMITIAAQAIGSWIATNCDASLVTVAANVDSDKKPSDRTAHKGRGWIAQAQCNISHETLNNILKTNAAALHETYVAKIEVGSHLAKALAGNCHSANVIAALYLATGQDIAHTVEGSLAETKVTVRDEGLLIDVRSPSILVGTIGGGTTLPAQKAALSILLKESTALRPPQQLAETIAAAVLAGELSLLAALSTQELASSHQKLGRFSATIDLL